MKGNPVTSLKLEAEFFRKRNNLAILRERKMRTLQVRGFHLLVLALILAAAALVAWRASHFLLTWDRLAIRSFRMENAPFYSRDDVRRVLKSYLGNNILALDVARLRGKLLAFREVKDVAIRRILPAAVAISFERRRPFFQRQRAGGTEVFDAQGVLLTRSRAGTSDPGLIAIRGGDPGTFALHAAALAEIAARIEFVDAVAPYGIALKLKGCDEIFYPGDGSFRQKLAGYFQIKKRWGKAGEPWQTVDLRIPGRIYLGYRQDTGGGHEE